MSNTLLYTVTVLVWGSTWLAITYQLGVVPPEVSIVYRYLLAAALMFVWCLARGLPLRFGRRAHGYFVLFGLLLFGLNYVFAYRAQQYVPSAFAALAFSSLVWMNIINARLFFGTRSGVRVWLGATLGMLGLAVLFAPQLRGMEADAQMLRGGVFCLLGALTASLGNMASQHAQSRRLPVLQGNAWGMLYGALLMAVIPLATGEPFLFEATPSYVLSLLYLAVVGSIVGFASYLTLLGRIGSHRAGYVVVMFPVVAIVLSVLFEGLRVDANLLGGVALVLAGNALILSRRRRAPA